MRSVVIFLIGAILGVTLKSVDCHIVNWQYWVCMLCVAAAYTVGLLTD